METSLMFTCLLYQSEYFKETYSEVSLATCVILIIPGSYWFGQLDGSSLCLLLGHKILYFFFLKVVKKTVFSFQDLIAFVGH